MKPKGNIKHRQKGEPISEVWKRYIVEWTGQKGKSFRDAEERFGVSRSSISDWKRAILHGKNLYTPGRPPILANKAIDRV